MYYNNNIIFIWDKNIENMSNEYKNKINKFLKDSCIRLGISKVFHDILDCKKYYEQGVKALNIGKLVYPEALIIRYDSILIYELIDSNPRMSFEDFKNTTLEKLKAYDYEKNTDLYKTLLVYLKNNKSIQHSAEELFIHRNTMRIRLQKIFELTHVNFNNVEEIFNIYLAYKVNEFVNKSNGTF
ncbi:PucR family transcriptional regulator [Clostridium sp. UBA7503]|uniref:PucR family transcriptional regulator n=1 Tax=Clostridium sp. UBA7503 TaxID=1946377 RepID=UPI003216C97D